MPMIPESMEFGLPDGASGAILAGAFRGGGAYRSVDLSVKRPLANPNAQQNDIVLDTVAFRICRQFKVWHVSILFNLVH